MAKKKRNYNLNRIKARHPYDFKEIANTLKIRTGTVQNWHKQGLKVIDETSKPYLAYGSEFIRFLGDRRQKQRHQLKAGEFFCAKCQKPQKSLSYRLEVIITDKRLGKTSKQAFIKGVCEVCDTRLTLFSSDKKAQEWQKETMLLVEHNTNLYGNGDSSLNNDIERGGK